MTAFFANHLVTVVLIALLVLGGVFVLARWGRPGSGTGGVTGQPRPKPDPYGNKQPGGYKPPVKPKGDGTA